MWRIVLVGLALLLSSCSGHKSASVDTFDEFLASIEENVAESDRAAAMQEAGREMEGTMQELLDLTAEKQQSLSALAADYDSSRAQFDELFSDFLERRESILERMFALHLEIKQKATAEEWKVLVKKQHDVVNQFAKQNISPSAGS